MDGGRGTVQRAAARTRAVQRQRHGQGRCGGRQHGREHRAEDEHDAHTGARRERRLRRLREDKDKGSGYKGCVEKQDRHWAWNAPTYAHRRFSRRLIPTCFSTSELRAATIGLPLYPSSTWLSTWFSVAFRQSLPVAASSKPPLNDPPPPIPIRSLPLATPFPSCYAGRPSLSALRPSLSGVAGSWPVTRSGAGK